MKHLNSMQHLPLSRVPTMLVMHAKKCIFRSLLVKTLLPAILFLAFVSSGQLSAQCPVPPGSFLINNQKISDIFPGGGTWPAGSTVVVTGKLTIDQSLTVTDITFLMNTSALILVKGATTTFTVTTGVNQFKGCSQGAMWEGIQVTSGAKINFSGINLKDAYIGIHFIAGANRNGSIMNNCYLENNLTGIGILGFSSSSAFSFASFNGNRIIRGTPGPILPPPPNHPYSGTQLFRGIWVGASVVDLGVNAAAYNKIQGYRYGMLCVSSTVRVANMHFQNSENDAVLSDTLDGTDIYSVNSNLVVNGAGSTQCQFFNAYNSSIISRTTKSLLVTGAQFDDPKQYGIRCSQSIALSAPITILGNVFVMDAGNNIADDGKTVDAIYIERPPSGPAAINVLIKNNTISLSSGHQKKPMMLIDVQGKVQALDIVSIDNNPITNAVTFPRISGIRVTGKGNNYNITNNAALRWFPASNTPGDISSITSRAIIASDLLGTNHMITANSITSKQNSQSSFLRAAVYLDNNPLSVSVCSNTTLNTYKGFECLKALGGTVLKRNNIGSAVYGFYSTVDTKLPNQDRFENVWTAPAYAQWGAYCSGTPSFQFFFDPSNAIPNDAPPSWWPLNLFVPLAGSNGVCIPNQNTLTENELLIIGGCIPNATAGDWDARRWLLYKLMNYPDLVSSNPGAADFLASSEAAATSPWKFARSEYLFDHAWLTSTTAQQSQMAGLGGQYQSIASDIAVLDQQMAQSATGYSVAIAQQLAYKFNELTSKTDALEQQRTYAAPSIQTSLQDALTFAQALPEVKVYEDNLKDILVIAIREAQGDTIVENDFARLREIAAQCPNTGGISVRRAPMWMLPEEGINYSDKDWDNGCGQPRSSNRNQDFSDTDGVQVMPNPANEMVHIVCPVNTATWAVFDATGRIVTSGNKPEEGFDISTTHWTSGFYFLSSRTSEGRVNTVKFSIIH